MGGKLSEPRFNELPVVALVLLVALQFKGAIEGNALGGGVVLATTTDGTFVPRLFLRLISCSLIMANISIDFVAPLPSFSLAGSFRLFRLLSVGGFCCRFESLPVIFVPPTTLYSLDDRAGVFLEAIASVGWGGGSKPEAVAPSRTSGGQGGKGGATTGSLGNTVLGGGLGTDDGDNDWGWDSKAIHATTVQIEGAPGVSPGTKRPPGSNCMESIGMSRGRMFDNRVRSTDMVCCCCFGFRLEFFSPRDRMQGTPNRILICKEWV